MTVVQMYVCTNYKLFLRFSWFLKSLDNVISMNSIPGIFKLFIFDVNVSYQLLVLKFIHFQNMSLNIKTFARTGNEESIQVRFFYKRNFLRSVFTKFGFNEHNWHLGFFNCFQKVKLDSDWFIKLCLIGCEQWKWRGEFLSTNKER